MSEFREFLWNYSRHTCTWRKCRCSPIRDIRDIRDKSIRDFKKTLANLAL